MLIQSNQTTSSKNKAQNELSERFTEIVEHILWIVFLF